MKKLLTFFCVLLFHVSFSQVQCNSAVTPPSAVVCIGDSFPVSIQASITSIGQSFSFNGSVLPAGWSVGGGSTFTSPCGQSPDNTPYYWASTAGSGTPYVATAAFDIGCGGSLEFDMVYSIQSGAAPCEGPDLYNEGVEVQYSTNNGVTWNSIIYYPPVGGTLSSTPASTAPGASGSTPYTSWSTFTLPIPAAAWTSSTMFRWVQFNSSGSDYDTWGLDNVFINAGPCNSAYVDWDGDALADPTAFNFTPLVDTFLVAAIYDTSGVFHCFSDTIWVDVVEHPTPYAGVNDTICFGSAFALSGTLSNSANSGLWTYNTAGISPTPTVSFWPNFSSMTPTVNVNQPGVYSFILKETSSVCGIVRDTVKVTVIDQTQTTSFTAPSCVGVSDGTISITSSTAVEYSFDNGINWQSSNYLGGFDSGTYSVCSRNSTGCVECSQVIIPVASPLVITAGNDQVICENGTATFWANASSIANPIYHWSHDSTNFSPTATDHPTVSPSIYSVYVESASGCVSDTVTMTVTIRPPLYADISSNATICPGFSTTIGISEITGGLGSPYNIVWNSGQSSSGSSDSIVVNPTTTTMYSVTITDNCESTPLILETEVVVAPLPVPAIIVTDPNICENAVFEITNATDPALTAQLEWNLPNNVNVVDQFVVYTDSLPQGVYDVQLIVTTPQGCVDSLTFNDVLTSEPKPQADFYWSPNPVLMFNTEVILTNNSLYASNYQWIIPNGQPSSSSFENPTTHFPEGVVGEYPVTLIAYSEFGCLDSITKKVVVTPEVIIYVPNSFTPDGDEFNQMWNVHIEGIDEQSFELKVYNRWGEIIWESNDIHMGWDGTYMGKIVPQGTYVWTIQAKDRNNDAKYNWNGHLNLLR